MAGSLRTIFPKRSATVSMCALFRAAHTYQSDVETVHRLEERRVLRLGRLLQPWRVPCQSGSTAKASARAAGVRIKVSVLSVAWRIRIASELTILHTRGIRRVVLGRLANMLRKNASRPSAPKSLPI